MAEHFRGGKLDQVCSVHLISFVRNQFVKLLFHFCLWFSLSLRVRVCWHCITKNIRCGIFWRLPRFQLTHIKIPIIFSVWFCKTWSDKWINYHPFSLDIIFQTAQRAYGITAVSAFVSKIDRDKSNLAYFYKHWNRIEQKQINVCLNIGIFIYGFGSGSSSGQHLNCSLNCCQETALNS